MDSSTTFIIALILVAASLLAVSLINQRQTRKRLISQKFSSMKRHVANLEDLSIAVETLVESREIPSIIVDEIINVIHNMEKLDPSSPYIQPSLQAALKRKEALKTKRCELFRLQESDAAIARAHFHLSEAARICRKHQSQGLIQLVQLENYIEELAWANMMVNIVSHVGQGHKAVNRKDVLRASAFYKKAQKMAVETNHSDERRQRIIKEIGEIMHGHRLALSPDIMPETLYNPVEGYFEKREDEPAPPGSESDGAGA